jgi:hypothetical protein
MKNCRIASDDRRQARRIAAQGQPPQIEGPAKHPFRVQMPEGKLSRGGSKAWLAEAPRKPLSSYRRNPRRRTRSKAQVGGRPAAE